MAQSAFAKRFPHGRLFLLVAILVGLSFTVWSFLKVPTTTQEHAAGYTCGASNSNPRCPAGYKCSYTQGNPNFGGSCITSSLSAPTNLLAGVLSCKNQGVINYNWKAVSGAQGYFLFYKYQGAAQYTKRAVGNVTSYSITDNTLNGRRIDWYVEAETTSDTSPKSLTHLTPAPISNCH